MQMKQHGFNAMCKPSWLLVRNGCHLLANQVKDFGNKLQVLNILRAWHLKEHVSYRSSQSYEKPSGLKNIL